MLVGILGLGEVGKAIKKMVEKKHQVLVQEMAFDEIAGKKLDILHVCIPFNAAFLSSVETIIKETKPALVIINSTIKPGTTAHLFKLTKVDMVHAPIDGVHPYLYEYLFKFKKALGPVNETSFKKAKKHFEELGVKVVKFNTPQETELAKVMSTTYYGWNIIFEKWVHQVCEQTGADFDQVYTQFNDFYNQGYKKDLPNVIRPVLKHKSGTIGGHCVIPNANIIQDWLQDDVSKFLLEFDKKLKNSEQ